MQRMEPSRRDEGSPRLECDTEQGQQQNSPEKLPGGPKEELEPQQLIRAEPGAPGCPVAKGLFHLGSPGNSVPICCHQSPPPHKGKIRAEMPKMSERKILIPPRTSVSSGQLEKDLL